MTVVRNFVAIIIIVKIAVAIIVKVITAVVFNVVKMIYVTCHVVACTADVTAEDGLDS